MKFYQKWQGRICDGEENNQWFPACVPGNIQYDYGVAHDFGDPDYMDNHRKYRVLEDVTWEYKTSLSFEKDEEETVWFVSHGIDYRYDIVLNGTKIYSYEGMYKKVELNLTDMLSGEDTLSVVIYPHPKREGAPIGTRAEASACCKPPVCYGWDWQPRLLISGMWQEAYIETRKQDFICSCEPFASLDESMTKGTVDFELVCDGTCEIVITDEDGTEVYRGSDTHIEIEQPHLWWCNGQGTPYLYQWTVTSSSDEKKGTLAFKKLRLVQNSGSTDPFYFPKSRYDAPITVELNGRRILAKGSNWVNPELFWGNIQESCYESRLALVKDANMNMLRIWGGAGVNKESFYDICDRLGIMVWQEFPLACNKYPDTEEYLTVLESEAIAIIELLRHHACLAFWCGGNELFNSWSGMDDQSLPLRLLDRLCYEKDYGRPFMKTSPLTGMGHGGYSFVNEMMQGDIFHTMRSANLKAYTEFGLSSINDIQTLKKMMPEEELYPVKETQAWKERHGVRSWGPIADSWVCQKIQEKYFGETESLEQLVEQSNILQCIGYQAAFENARQQWPHCSMILNWCFNEPWNNAANLCLVNYPARPKKSYVSVKNALRPTMFSAGIDKYDWKEGEKFSADIWLLNDRPEEMSGSVTVELVMAEQTIKLLEWSAKAEANTNTEGPTVHMTLPVSEEDFFILRLRAENGMENEYRLLLRHGFRKKEEIKAMNQ